MQLFLKIPSGMANSVDPDETAPEGTVRTGSALFICAVLLETLVKKILGYLLQCCCFFFCLFIFVVVVVLILSRRILVHFQS